MRMLQKTRMTHLMKVMCLLLALVMGISFGVPAFAEGEGSDENEENRFYLGKLVNAGNNDGFSETNEIDKDDPHYEWQLGKFFVSGYTQHIEDANGKIIFLKNVGDDVKLWFTLLQNIYCINDDEDLTISAEEAGYDDYFKTKTTDFGKGTLIIRHRDYQNNLGEPQIYTNYLDALTKGADTQVQICEEGDYEVALDYEVEKKKSFIIPNEYNEYRISFEFSVRNGNNMVFPRDVVTNEELTNTAFTENGFYLDLAKSHYLKAYTKREILKDGADGLVADTRYNRPAKDGDKFTEEGVYTISIYSDYSNEPTVKKIYVGKDSILKAYVTTGLSIPEIRSQVENGATISENGTLTAVSTVVAEDQNDTDEIVAEDFDTASSVENDSEDEKKQEDIEEPVKKGKKSLFPWEYLCIGILSFLVIVLFILLIRKNGKKDKQKNDTVVKSVDSSTDDTKGEKQ